MTRMPVSLLALAVGTFGIGVTEFVIRGLLMEVGVLLGTLIGQTFDCARRWGRWPSSASRPSS